MAPKKEPNQPQVSHLDTMKRVQNPTLDDWFNPRTGTGTNRSKQSGVQPMARLLSYTDALKIYEASDTAQRIVDVPAEEMTRAGVDVRIPDDHEGSEAMGAALDDLNAHELFAQAVSKTRCFGGAVALINVTDGVTDPSQPINEKGIQSVDSLTIFDPLEAHVSDWKANPAGTGFGLPEFYSIHPQSIGAAAGPLLNRVHHSRVIHFTGPMISRSQQNQNQGFGMSVLDSVWTQIARFDQNYEAAGALMDDFAQAVFKIKGLASSMASDRGAAVKRRLELIDAYRSFLRGVALDADHEDFERKSTPVTGLPELIDRFAQRLAAACRMPVTVLMGQSPAGLNATGASDVRMWYDFISTQQHRMLRRPYERLAHLLQLAKNGPTKGVVAENFSIQFKPLWQPSEKEQADTRQVMANADQIYLTAGVVDAEEIRKSRFGGDTYSVNTEIEDDSMEDPEAEDLADEEGVTRMGPDGKPAQVMSGQTLPTGTAPGAAKAQDTALNGAQVTSAVEIVKAVHSKELPRESGIAMLIEFFNLSPEAATKIMGPETFKPVKPEPVAVPPQPGQPAQQPGIKPPEEKKQ